MKRLLLVALPVALFGVVLGVLGQGQNTPQVKRDDDKGKESGQEFVLALNQVGSFSFEGRNHSIWASIYNSDSKPRLWQFRYDPLFRPQVKKDGQLDIVKSQLPSKKWLVSLPIVLDTKDASIDALESLKTIYPDQANQIQPGSVQVIPIRNIDIDIPKLKDDVAGAELRDTQIPIFGPPSVIRITLEAPNEKVADQIAQYLPEAKINYSISFSAKTAALNSVEVSMTQLLNTSLYTKLNGVAQKNGTVYVQRNRSGG